MESFIKRVSLLSRLDVNEIASLLETVKIDDSLSQFIEQNKDSCRVATGNLQNWIAGLAKRIACRVYASQGEMNSSGKLRLTKILRKEDIVRKYQELGHEVVFVGDGNNDAEAMRISDVSIACGLVHAPANSVMQVADYAVYDSRALLRLLAQLQKPRPGKSVVIPAAGIGSRLGLGQTKSLLQIANKSLIRHQLEMVHSVEDIRVVVGFQARELIEEVLKYRRDIIFAFNHNYFDTKTAASLYFGARHANATIIVWDGDLLVHPDDVTKCLEDNASYVGVSEKHSEDGIFVEVDEAENVTGFSREIGAYEWTGPACVPRDKIGFGMDNIFNLLEPLLPLPIKKIQARDIDTYQDYQNAIGFVRGWTLGNREIDRYYGKLASKIQSSLETRNKAPDFTEYDVNFVKKYANKSFRLLDLGAGTGLMVNNIVDDFLEITAVEKYKEFSNFIIKSPKVRVVNSDILNYSDDRMYDLITLFGVMNFFNSDEAQNIYKMTRNHLDTGRILIVKHQMGLVEDVVVNGYSEELEEFYYSEYRSLSNEIRLIEDSGYSVIDAVDIYPKLFNRWENTHFYALVCKAT